MFNPNGANERMVVLLNKLFKNKNVERVLESDEMAYLAGSFAISDLGLHVLENGTRLFCAYTDFDSTVAVRYLPERGCHVEFYPKIVEGADGFINPLFTDGTVGPVKMSVAVRMINTLLNFNVDKDMLYLFEGAYMDNDGVVIARGNPGLHFAWTEDCLAKYGLRSSSTKRNTHSMHSVRLFDYGVVFFTKTIDGTRYIIGRAEDSESLTRLVYDIMVKDVETFIGVVPMNEIIAGQKISLDANTYLVARANNLSLDCVDEAELCYEKLTITDTRVCVYKNIKAA